MEVKFANIDFEGYQQEIVAPETNVNIGDFIEIIAIDNLYKYMNLQSSDIKRLDFYDLENYQGPPVILPINFRLIVDYPQWNIQRWSSRIIPVFIGVSLVSVNLSEELKKTLKKYEPIGCRDEATYQLLRSYGIWAYLNACITLTLPSEAKLPQNGKIFLIDVPEKAKKYIPKDFYNKIEFLDHEFFGKMHEVWGTSYKEFTAKRLEKYKKEASLIITSRYHATISGLALGIPVITILENYHDKFGVLENLNPIYDSSNLDSINWTPKVIHYEDIKTLMLETAKNHILWKYHMVTGQGGGQTDAAECIKQMDKITHIFLNKSKRKRVEQSLVFSDYAIAYIKANWKYNQRKKVAIWGLSQTALNLIEFIHINYQNIEIVEIYDTFKAGKSVMIFDREYDLKSPNIENLNNDYFIFVASNSASKIAKTLFQKMNRNNVYLCHLPFITEL